MKRARFRKRNLTAQTSTPVLAQPGESLSLLFGKMSNEIKQGDKVRVSENAPKIYTKDGFNLATKMDFEVVEIEDECARIENADMILTMVYVLPTKYLVKVDAEAKEAKYHKGDRIKFKNIYELQKVKDKSFRWMLLMFASKEATITAVEDNGFYRVDIDPSIGGINDDMIERKVEPTEQTEAEKKPYDGISKETANEISDMLEAYAKALSGIADPFDWQIYEADLAKEIVLKTVNSASDRRPMAIAEYAVSVAKAVVEGLKGK
ncbi:MAG: hypothetical protein BHV69_09745 [Bacteroidales bacterium 52_46]|nr:MAG: hypothetical protein BHV69_09745 [Bacteroidales bacterium 52_46]